MQMIAPPRSSFTHLTSPFTSHGTFLPSKIPSPNNPWIWVVAAEEGHALHLAPRPVFHREKVDGPVVALRWLPQTPPEPRPGAAQEDPELLLGGTPVGLAHQHG